MEMIHRRGQGHPGDTLSSADILSSKGINARVVNISTVKPIDVPLVRKCARETGAIVTAEEHSIVGGLGSAVAEVIIGECPRCLLR